MVARRPNGVEGTSISGDHRRVRPTHSAPRAASGRPTSSRLCRSCKIPWQILKRDFAALLSQPMAASAAVEGSVPAAAHPTDAKNMAYRRKKHAARPGPSQKTTHHLCKKQLLQEPPQKAQKRATVLKNMTYPHKNHAALFAREPQVVPQSSAG